MAFLPPLGLFRPGLGQVQPHGDRPTRLPICVIAGDRDLTLAYCTPRAPVLPRHPDRGLALRGKARVIQDQDPIPQRSLSDHRVHPLAVQVFLAVLEVTSSGRVKPPIH
jgi:hypothetical protein